MNFIEFCLQVEWQFDNHEKQHQSAEVDRAPLLFASTSTDRQDEVKSLKHRNRYDDTKVRRIVLQNQATTAPILLVMTSSKISN